MWLAKLKKKKGQYLLLGIIFVIAIAMICVGTVVTVASSNFAAKYYEGDQTPDVIGITTNPKVAEKIKEFYNSKGEKVRNYKNFDVFSVTTNLSFNNEQNDAPVGYLVPIKDKDELANKIEINKGDKKASSPKMGEIWISSVTAKLKNIEVGDKAQVINGNGEKIEYEISAIVNDSNHPSSANSMIMVYVNESEIKNLESLPKANLLTFNCDGKSEDVATELTKYINEPLSGYIMDKNIYIMSATMGATLIGGIGLVTSIILVIILIYILRSNIKNNILKEYKSIGIYKSMGYSSKKIRKIYSNGYMLVSIVASVIGIIFSMPIIKYVCDIAFESIGKYTFDESFVLIALVTFLVFNLIVYFNVYTALRCLNKIKPIEAINIGVTSSKEKLKKSLIKNNSSSLAMAINDIYKNVRSNFGTLLVFILVFFISTFFSNLAYTMKNLESEYYKIFSTAYSDLTITAEGDKKNSIKEVKEYLDKDSRVEDYYLWDIIAQEKVTIDSNKYEITGGNVNIMIYNKFNEEDFSILKGINPRNENEVSVSKTILENNNLDIGDYINLKIDNEEKEFLIVGSFVSMLNGGQVLRVTSDVFEDSVGNIAFVNLKDMKSYEEVKNDINNKFDKVIVDKVYVPLKDSASIVVNTSVPISIALLIGVLIFGIFNIVNILLINNIDNRKNFGIMKSLGFTSKYIRNRNNIRIIMLAIIGAVVGTSITMLYSSNIMEMTMGIAASKINLNMTVALVVSIFVLIIVTLYICNKSIKKISTVELIKE